LRTGEGERSEERKEDKESGGDVHRRRR